MKKCLVVGFVILLMSGLAVTQARASLTYQLNTVFNGTATPNSTPSWLNATFETAETGTVRFSLTSSLENSSEFFSDFGFNWNGGPLSVTYVSGYSLSTIGSGEMQGTGGKNFSYLFSFDNAPPADRFKDEMSVVYLITGTGITEDSFSNLLDIAAHMQGITTDTGKTTSVAITASEPPVHTAVPIPPTAYLLGAGLVGLYGIRRRFSKKQK